MRPIRKLRQAMPNLRKASSGRAVAIRACLLLLVGVALASCESTPDDRGGPLGATESRPDGPSSRLVVPRSAPEPIVTRSEVTQVLEEIDEMASKGDWQGVLAAADLWLAKSITSDERRSLEAHRFVARRNLLQTLVLDGFVRVDPTRVTIGSDVTVEILFVNLSGRDLKILATAPGATPSALHLELSCVEVAADGGRVEDRRTQVVEVGEDIILAPGGRKSFKVPFTTSDRDLTSLALRRFTISATLWPSRLEMAGESMPGGIKLRPTTLDAFPRNWEHLADRPLERLRDAIGKHSAVHIPLCSALVADVDRPKARDLLGDVIRAQGSDGPSFRVRIAACVGLRLVTGLDIPADPDVWLKRLAEGFGP